MKKVSLTERVSPVRIISCRRSCMKYWQVAVTVAIGEFVDNVFGECSWYVLKIS